MNAASRGVKGNSNKPKDDGVVDDSISGATIFLFVCRFCSLFFPRFIPHVYFYFGCRRQRACIPVRSSYIVHTRPWSFSPNREQFLFNVFALPFVFRRFRVLMNHTTNFNLASMDCVRYENARHNWYQTVRCSHQPKPKHTHTLTQTKIINNASRSLIKWIFMHFTRHLLHWLGFLSHFVTASSAPLHTSSSSRLCAGSAFEKHILNKTFYCVFREATRNSWKMETQVKRWNAFSAHEILWLLSLSLPPSCQLWSKTLCELFYRFFFDGQRDDSFGSFESVRNKKGFQNVLARRWVNFRTEKRDRNRHDRNGPHKFNSRR